MSKFNQKIIEVTYKKKIYSVIQVSYKRTDVPVVMDKDDADRIIKLCCKLKCDAFCNIYCTINNKRMRLNESIIKPANNNETINLNGLGLDNRRVNLDNNKFIKKLSPENITLPHYIWYIKDDKTHGDRFMIKLNNYKWTTTSSKKLSTEAKLEQAKKKMIILRKDNPELFKNTYIDEKLVKKRKSLLSSFYKIIYKAGFTNVKKIKMDCNGNLIAGYKLTNKDKIILKILKKTSIDNIANKNNMNIDRLPKYVFYRKPYKNRGSYFAIENHPHQKKIWRTTTSTKVTDREKYIEMIGHYKLLNMQHTHF